MRGIKDEIAAKPGRKFRRGVLATLTLALAASLAACGSTPTPTSGKNKRSKEYFSESEYGVKASPRVTNQRTRLPRGGGRDLVGKPYKVKGQWYKPREDTNYRKVGMASWYGDAFHGRLTANGEIYDMTHLTAAHPTMPLPSYARVTNLKNNSSVIVRVNDRGPFARGRVIDLSHRAADMLDYTHSGTAQVRVEYVGRAPLHGKDDAYLLASYRPGAGSRDRERRPDLNDGLPSGVMIAMEGNTPTRRNAPTFPGTPVAAPAPVVLASAAPTPSRTFDAARIEAILAPAAAGTFTIGAGDPVLPEFGPLVPERPTFGIARVAPRMGGVMSYADQRVSAAAESFAAFDRAGNAAAIASAWKEQQARSLSPSHREFVAAGTFVSEKEARALAVKLASLGEARLVPDGDAINVELYALNGADVDTLVRQAWDAGATDAFVMRD